MKNSREIFFILAREVKNSRTETKKISRHFMP
ncbi:DUF1661 domain-containing protein [Porphyromonas gulae]